MRGNFLALVSVVFLLIITAAECWAFDAAGGGLSEPAAAQDTLEEKKSGERLRRWLHDFIFISPSVADTIGIETERSEEPFIPYEGKYIRNIGIVRLNVFGDSRVVERATEEPAIIKIGNSLHMDTRTKVISNYFLMKKGDRLDPFVIADTERILRRAPFIQDARIEVYPVSENPDSVDVNVVTRDLWSIGLRPTVKKLEKYKFKVYDRNFLGYGHNIEYEVDIDPDRSQEYDHNAAYRISNLYGTFIDGEARYVNSHDRNTARLSFNRGYVSPEIRYIGALSLYSTRRKVVNEYDVPSTFFVQDFWLGRSFSIQPYGTGREGRMRTVLACRVERTDFDERPPVSALTNTSFHERLRLLGGLSLTRSNYRKGKLIFGYGTTEDVQYGFLASLTGGHEIGEFFDRSYIGTEMGVGGFSERLGYAAWRIRVGSFIRDGDFEQGVLRIGSRYFSNLVTMKRYFFRQFATVDYTFGFERREDVDVLMEGRSGITGLSNTGLAGRQRLVMRLESVVFAPWDWYGFRVAFFGFADTGCVGPDWNSFLKARYYSGLGFGFRFHNERLVFEAVEIRFAFFPSVPPGSYTDTFEFSSVRSLDIFGFDPGPPSVVPYE